MKKYQEIRLVSSGDDMNEVLNEAEAFSETMKLSEKDSLRVRLLTEETMSMVRALTGELELTLSFISQADACIIKVETDTLLSPMKKENILSASTSGKNAAVTGVMEKIRDIFETAFMLPDGAEFNDYVNPALAMGIPTDMYSGQLMDVTYWTLAGYRSRVEEEGETQEQKEKWDELEKSVVSKLADDVQVGVKGNHVVMSIFYNLTNK
ncbi:hypothetical protein SAMN02910369_00978 [Lachnospiraceae bacterium NE2001]|nr:hypothetical protein SAMN02910369_00978 [Lachnospiraceae bacterium NE2001]